MEKLPINLRHDKFVTQIPMYKMLTYLNCMNITSRRVSGNNFFVCDIKDEHVKRVIPTVYLSRRFSKLK